MLPLIMAGVSIAGSVLGAIGKIGEGAAQKRALLARADAEKDQFTEQLRRTQGRQSQSLGQTQAGMGASGFALSSGSFNSYLSAMKDEFSKTNAYDLDQFNKSQQRIRDAADNGVATGLNVGAGLLGGASQAAGIYGALRP